MIRLSTHTCPVLRTIGIALLIASGSGAHAQEVQYILDTGTGTFNIGPTGFNANVTWLNVFDTIEGGELITKVAVSFGDITGNSGKIGSDLVTVTILDDPNNDHDPTDAVVLSTAIGRWAEVGFSNFIDYPIEPTEVNGVFFVAVVMDVLDGAGVASMDPFVPSNGTRSWLFYNPEPNLDDLGSSPFIVRMSDAGFHGAWMVRATGESPPICVADFTGDGVLNFFDVSAFLGAFDAQDQIADLNDDGLYNFFDVSDFLGAFADGCP